MLITQLFLTATLVALPFDDLTQWTTRAHGHSVSVENGELELRSMDAPVATMVTRALDPAWLESAGGSFSGELRTDAVAVSATLVVEVNGEAGRLFVDDMRGRVINGTTDWQRYTIAVPPLPGATEVKVGVLLVGAGDARFRNLEWQPHAVTEPSVEAVAYLDAALHILRTRYRDRDRVDWEALRTNALPAAGVDAHSAMRVVVAQLRDRHAAFYEPGYRARQRDDAVQPITGSLLGGRFAYVAVPGFSGEADGERAAHFAIDGHRVIHELALADPCGWVVDLRDSGGGNMWPRLAALGPLLGEGTLGMHVADDERAVWEYRDGAAWAITDAAARRRIEVKSPIAPLTPLPPVAVLLSERTASAGEALAIAFIGRPDTRSFGVTTAGYASANVAVPLADGAVLAFPGGYTADRTGAVHEPNVTPDVVIDGAPTQLVPQPALDWLEAACYGNGHD